MGMSTAMSLGKAAMKEAAPVVGAALRDEISRDVGEEDLSWLSSLGSAALHAGERVAADAVKKEIARRLGEEDLSWLSTAMSLGKAAMHEAAPVVGAALRD